MIVIVYGGLAYCQSKDAHISVDWLVKLSNQKTQAVLRIVVFVIILGFLTIALWATLERFLIALEVNEKYEGLAFMPMWPARLMLLLGVFWFCVQIFVDALRSIIRAKPIQ
jgi:TRAP-type C4-dicarboxylate transport system permease small subunit